MKKFALALMLAVIAVSSSVSAQPQKEELLSSPRFLKNPQKAVFKKLSLEQVRDSIKIVSGRTSASFQFNTPEVVVILPFLDNSTYAVVTFEKPEVLDAKNKAIPFEWERGGYDAASFSTQIRLLNKADSRPLVFFRVRGSGMVRYPLEIQTVEFDKKKSRAKPGEVELDGPFITYVDRNIEEMFFLNAEIGPVRAFDVNKRRLESYPFKGSLTEGEITKRRLAFWGEISTVEVDTVMHWAKLEFEYDLPPSKPIPEEFSGVPRSDLPKGVGMTTGKVSLRGVSRPGQQVQKPVPSKGSKPQKNSSSGIPLHVAVAVFPEADVLKLIPSAADINQQNEAGWTALHTASYRCDRARTVQALIDAGADVNLKTKEGQTSLWLARSMKCSENQRILERAGAR
ncbi:MAG: ankyrin repeat domain-containing protein [Thermodesulfobacteriota bacterium]